MTTDAIMKAMLARLASRFEMHVYTLGKRRYAMEILKFH